MGMMNNKSILFRLNIDQTSRVPKYKQIIQSIISEIELGKLKVGDRIPSINETSEEYYLSRDTVEKAYTELRKKGVVTAVRGKGYYVSSAVSINKIRVLMLFNKLSSYKKIIYNAFLDELGDQAVVDLQIHNYQAETFELLLTDKLGSYDYYVVMPHFEKFTHSTQQLLDKIAPERLLLLDKKLENMKKKVACVYQAFEDDIYQALNDGLDLLKKYQKLILTFPKHNQYNTEIIQGFRVFCVHHHFPFAIWENISEQSEVNKGDAFVVIDEPDLVNLIKICRNQQLTIGQDVGIVSYNETPLKQVLCDGITVISTDFEQMGKTAARLLMDKKIETIANPFKLIRRKTL